MIIKKVDDIRSSEITSESSYLNRRRFMGASGTLIAGGLLASCAEAEQPKVSSSKSQSVNAQASLQYQAVDKSSKQGFYTNEKLTPEKDITSYNNFYEFGTDKSDPKRYADKLTTKPWTVEVVGAAENTGTFNLEDILAKQMLEERIYRLRCVEAWSMVVPWVGFSLAAMLKQFKPTSKAKYVRFETLRRRSEMRGQRSRSSIIDWPYQEGLRIDEAMHPLAFIATGLYGKEIPKQNGAPLRLVMPWKYGFKSIKSIVKIEFSERQPNTSWVELAPREYGFYANVNPSVDHPRWSQASERRLPSTLFEPNRILTEPFNGYGEQVASLYSGMDLSRHF